MPWSGYGINTRIRMHLNILHTFYIDKPPQSDPFILQIRDTNPEMAVSGSVQSKNA